VAQTLLPLINRCTKARHVPQSRMRRIGVPDELLRWSLTGTPEGWRIV